MFFSVIKRVISTLFLVTMLVVIIISCIPDAASVATLQLTPVYSLGTPPAIDSYAVTVSAGGTVSATVDDYTTGDSISVPAGVDLSIDLVATVSGTSTSAALTFKGVADITALSSGATETQNLAMIVNTTKLVIPDSMNNRLVQIDTIAGENWQTLAAGDISYGDSFVPYDVDFDALGRLIVANPNGGTDFTSIFRIDDMSSGSYTSVIWNKSVQAVAVDRVNNIAYFVTSGTLEWVDLSAASFPTTSTALDVSTVDPRIFHGLEYDGNGHLYIANETMGIVRYTIATETVAANVSKGNDIWDLLYRDGNLYALNNGAAADENILQLDPLTLDTISGYGTTVGAANTNPGQFYGPRRFIAQLNDGFIIIDDGFDFDKLIRFNDMTGSGWTTFGVSGSGTGEFIFFETPD